MTISKAEVFRILTMDAIERGMPELSGMYSEAWWREIHTRRRKEQENGRIGQ